MEKRKTKTRDAPTEIERRAYRQKAAAGAEQLMKPHEPKTENRNNIHQGNKSKKSEKTNTKTQQDEKTTMTWKTRAYKARDDSLDDHKDKCVDFRQMDRNSHCSSKGFEAQERQGSASDAMFL